MFSDHGASTFAITNEPSRIALATSHSIFSSYSDCPFCHTHDAILVALLAYTFRVLSDTYHGAFLASSVYTLWWNYLFITVLEWFSFGSFFAWQSAHLDGGHYGCPYVLFQFYLLSNITLLFRFSIKGFFVPDFNALATMNKSVNVSMNPSKAFIR